MIKITLALMLAIAVPAHAEQCAWCGEELKTDADKQLHHETVTMDELKPYALEAKVNQIKKRHGDSKCKCYSRRHWWVRMFD